MVDASPAPWTNVLDPFIVPSSSLSLSISCSTSIQSKIESIGASDGKRRWSLVPSAKRSAIVDAPAAPGSGSSGRDSRRTSRRASSSSRRLSSSSSAWRLLSASARSCASRTASSSTLALYPSVRSLCSTASLLSCCSFAKSRRCRFLVALIHDVRTSGLPGGGWQWCWDSTLGVTVSLPEDETDVDGYTIARIGGVTDFDDEDLDFLFAGGLILSLLSAES
mmetsp:Transcript_12326/g.28186  ORF Transcript_12326/g.28186 Transcript_12326/m.28186 type:complete len:222 (+) Transcript_12326:391-1056(+)